MSRAITIFSIIGALCFLGVYVAFRMYLNAQNQRRTEKARAVSIENKQARKIQESEPKQMDLFGADDVKDLTN